ncbi:MAG: tetraacyldisaccharide 4'-kinase [Pseudomonadota bacterium]
MRAPAFWWQAPEAPGLKARLLAPASLLWRLGAALRKARACPERASVPLICIGNLTAGGAGKTPLVRALAARLAAAGHTPHILLRGHGGRLGRTAPHRVDPARDGFADVGDEALLHAAQTRTWVARDRLAGARAAARAGAELILMDDGLQNPAILPDLAILVVDAGQGFGNGRVMPAGPLREPVAEGLARIAPPNRGLAVLIGEPEARARLLAAWPALAAHEPIPARLAPLATGLPIAGLPVVAFAGIGRPEKFFDTLRALGAQLRRAEAFADHAAYAPAVLTRLQREARAAGAMLVTTEKDAVRLPPAFRREVLVLPVALETDRWDALDAAIAPLLASSPRDTTA